MKKSTIQITGADSFIGSHLTEALVRQGHKFRSFVMLIHELAPFKACPRMDLAMAQLLTQRLINIPSSSSLVSPTI